MLRSRFGIIEIFGIIICAFLGLAASHQPKKPKRFVGKELPFPSESNSLETPDVGITGLFVDGAKVAMAVDNRGYFITLPILRLDGATRDANFANLGQAVRHVIDASVGVGGWRGIIAASPRLVLLDGLNMRAVSVSAKENQFIAMHSIPWDIVRPPRDRGGEPTHAEIDSLRKTFKQNFMQTNDLKLAGMGVLPNSKENGTAFIIASRVASYPVLTMQCEASDSSQCRLDRVCNVHGTNDLTPGSVSGIAYSKKHNVLLLGDRRRQRIIAFRFYSCMDIERVGELALPAKLKPLSNLFVDADDRLWVSTMAADDYLNASVYFWDSQNW